MRTFEGWMEYQRMDPRLLDAKGLAEWRHAYEGATERANRVQPWTPKARRDPADHLYAVAIRDGSSLWLFLWVRRSAKGEYFVLIPRPDGAWNPHASYHRDGRLHQKGHDQKMLPASQRQKPDSSFRGTEQMLSTPIEPETGREVKALCDPSQFSDIFEIPVEHITGRGHLIAIDLTERDAAALWTPSSEVIAQKRFAGVFPEILVTHWKQTLTN